MVSHLKAPILTWFTYLLCADLTDSEFCCLAMLAKAYPVSGPPYLPQMPNQLDCMSKGAHKVLGTILVARRMSAFIMKLFSLSCMVQLGGGGGHVTIDPPTQANIGKHNFHLHKWSSRG